MPTQRDIRLLCKPLIERRDDLICVNRYLLFVPLRSFFAGLCFERSSDRDALEPRPIIKALCRLRTEWPFAGELPFIRPGYRTWRQAYGERGVFDKKLLDRIKPEPWLMSDPDYPDALRKAIENEMLPKIMKYTTWKKALDFETRSDIFGEKSDVRILLPYFLAQGEFSRAKNCLGDVIESYRQTALKDFNNNYPGLGDRLAEQGDKLSIDDKRALIAILHEREAAAICALKLEKYWQPTPFPAEEQRLV
jgi:hypothetical protein